KLMDRLAALAPKLLVGLFVIFIGFWLIRILKKWLSRRLVHKEMHSSVRPFILNLVVVSLQVLLVIFFMNIVGIQMTTFAAIIGAFGVAAGLALSGTLQNFTSGILILLLKPFKIGDTIIAQGQEGTVESIQIFFTIVKTYDNRTIIIPNSKLSNEVIVNLSREGTRRIDIEMKFSFAFDFEEVKQLIEKSIKSKSDLLNDPPYRIGVSSIEPDGFKVMANVWSPAHGFIDSRLLLQQQIIEDLKTGGIKLPGT
ncbi:MAG: mechanosensitive ion channel family protein, partial [Flavitalea sp.]